MKIELTEKEISQAIVDWLAHNLVIRGVGPWDVCFNRSEGGPLTATVARAKEEESDSDLPS